MKTRRTLQILLSQPCWTRHRNPLRCRCRIFGPIAIPLPLGPRGIPGGIWPENHLRSIGTVIYERGVDVQIVLSNLNSIPANLGATAANCGNGWTCADGVFDVVNNGVFDGVFNKTINGDVR